ncbi:Conserved regulator of innate immunity protein 3 [Trichinella nativa]|uniref:Conserved regulator of innate immunity protein 3 n=1 Tax=Trichinella nativa TaxID=6335 RepID=A0A0V1KRR3_9BILA|nr:Conserved regulator of innate immunity protein 3 [Trichinella nativa]
MSKSVHTNRNYFEQNIWLRKLKFSKWQAVLLPFITISTGKMFQPISCGNGSSKFFSSKVDSMLSEFLKDEIEAEKKIAKQQLPTGQVPAITGFQLTSNEDEITLNKTFGSEKISVKFHVSHSVDTAPDFESDESQEQQKGPSVISKPSFTVSIEKENQKLVFECAFIEQYEDDVEANQPNDDTTDLFNIEEIYMYSGDATDNIYSVRGDIIDGVGLSAGLYDHLMTYLEERGIDHHFAEQLIKFSTHYEHAQYVALLQRIREFVGLPENQSHLQRITVIKAPPVYTAFNYHRVNVIPFFVSPLERTHYSLPVKGATEGQAVHGSDRPPVVSREQSVGSVFACMAVRCCVVMLCVSDPEYDERSEGTACCGWRTAKELCRRGKSRRFGSRRADRLGRLVAHHLTPTTVVARLIDQGAQQVRSLCARCQCPDRLNFGLTFVFIDGLASLLQVRSGTIIEI